VETELETQLKQAEQQVRELRSANHRLLLENTSVKEKLEALSREHHTRVSELEIQVNQLRAKGEETVKRIRQLEQTNDDLERANRFDSFFLSFFIYLFISFFLYLFIHYSGCFCIFFVFCYC